MLRRRAHVPAVALRARGRLVGAGTKMPAAHRIVLFVAVLTAAAVMIYVLALPGRVAPFASVPLPWPILAAGFAIAEMKVVTVHFRRETHSFSLSEFPAVIGLFFLSPVDYLLALIVGSAAVLVVAERQGPAKLAFNLSNFALTGVVSLAVFHAVVTPDSALEPVDWAAAFASSIAATIVGALATATVITISGGAPQYEKLPEMLQFGGIVAIANTSLALLAVSLFLVSPLSLILLAVPLATVFVAYGAYVSEREKHERLELLYQSSRILQHSPELDSSLVALLEHTRNMFRAEWAQIILYPRKATDEALRTISRHDGDSVVMEPVADLEHDAIEQRARKEQRPFLYLPLPTHRVFGGIKQAMVSPLRGESDLIGSFVIANRLTAGTAFTAEDLKLFETLANQSAIALENGQLEQSLAELSRLKEQLRYQAYHDPLTNLANRSLFVERVDERLARPAGDKVPVVLFLDLDDFKVVNDTLGHAAGDRLLSAAAERIRSCVRADDLAARLGGDEFAVLIEDQPDLSRAVAVANRIIEAMRLPFPVEGQDMSVTASIGIAAAKSDMAAADELLRNADVAMYIAKANGKGRAAVFEPTMHAAIVARHALSAELSRGVGKDEFDVFYQPILALQTGALAGVEALVRWHHPTRGLVTPDEFIPLAEENGTILTLGRWVLYEACRQVAEWTETRRTQPITLTVNLAAAQLREPGFMDDLDGILGVTKLTPSQLVLEMTETAMFHDTATTIARLQDLRARGIRIAIDDFGTGYSSLGYLRRFPVDILKIAREFVDDDSAEWAFPAAIIALGRTLNLRIVAEGIEQEWQLERLRSLGCELGQGFYFARPTDAAGFEAYVAARHPGQGKAARRGLAPVGRLIEPAH
ncbi:MAG TPA: EAL domain-containing protein [Patescibacteria group bacterium]|nr:EAL domain-containing protein [Patescibacteria group bacterium]